jgi:putative peptidoglycan lipid II flippase
VSLASLDYREMARCVAAALTGGGITWIVFSWMAGELFPRMNVAGHQRLIDLAVLVAGGLLWGGITLWVLTRTGSALPKVMMQRLRLA